MLTVARLQSYLMLAQAFAIPDNFARELASGKLKKSGGR
jgi:hypothetical protein